MVTDAELVAWARSARYRAYAPFSGFHVGAAVLTAQGHVHTGCNVESASYPLTCCAERVAIYKAVSVGETEVEAIAVATALDPPATPCGACRQVIWEFGPDARVLMAAEQGPWVEMTIRDLLPGGFDGAALRRR